ncbi:MAG: UDP-glucose 4-epimerase GalE [Ignavibacteria bacterium RBG_13_36_8]|nr:MAG: UDP-glucose 4-epimerase GalE [Ignavibacteria bacterium RBG_13_36_8]
MVGVEKLSILVTGGAGYIGSHFVRKLVEHKKEIIVFDNLSRGHKESLPFEVKFEKIDLMDNEKLISKMSSYKIDSIVHFAALANVGESVEKPELYYSNNVIGSLNLMKAAANYGVKKFVFSSTCSVYGNPDKMPITEDAPLNPINPYAHTKITIENILNDFDKAFGLKFVSLRYFNAAGADFSGEIGESHNPETHLIPIILKTVLGKQEKVSVYGNDYNTSDGTCIRDYIHVNDLADAHLKALDYLEDAETSEFINLGTGEGNSVMEVLKLSEDIVGNSIKYEIIERRSGDPAVLVADNKKAKLLLDWLPQYGLKEIIHSAWSWHKNQKF